MNAVGVGPHNGCTSRLLKHAMFGFIILVLLVMMLLGALPTWPHSRSWGYYPSGGIGLLAVVVLVLLLVR